MLRLLGSACALCAASCSSMGFGDVQGAPDDQGIPSPPGEAPPTGSKWQGVEVEGECGGTTLAWVLVDEVCGGTTDPGYLDAFHAPIFRDGAVVGSTLYTVDASYLWALDATDPTDLARQGLVAGVGQPLALAARGGDLLVAAGGEGLLILDGADPASPARKAQVELPGPALDVYVEGDLAYVAVGAAGLSIVDLAATPPALLQTIAVPGFAAAVKAQGGLAYVAACDTFAVVDPSIGAVLSTTWLSKPYDDGGVLVAPAKDVELVGGVAFVAAGRFGAVAFDVSVPEAPALLGNCTVSDDLGFYASGVAAADGQLFVAGGEWGILRVDASEPAAACSYGLLPMLPPPPAGAGECSSEPPWQVVPWQDQWAPPPPMPGKDPIHVLPAAGLLYAFGDATRIGLRAVDVRLSDPSLDKVGRYEEPRLYTGIAAANGRVLVAGPAGGLYLRDDASLLTLAPEPVPIAADAVACALLDDGRWVAATGAQQLHIEGVAAPLPLPGPVWPNGLATFGTDVLVPTSTGAAVFHDGGGTAELVSSGRTAALPQAVVANAEGVFLASPEWIDSVQIAGAPTALTPHAVFDADDIMDANLWRTGLPRRLLAVSPAGVVEIASLADRAGLMVHGAEPKGIPLPSGTYVGAAAEGSRVYLVSADRGTYRSQLVTVELGGAWPALAGIESFTGMASGVAADGDRLYVADADRGIRVYLRTAAATELLGVVTPEVSP